MPEVPELDWSKLKPKIKETFSTHGVHTNFTKLKSKSIKRMEKQLIELEQQRLGEEEYQRKLGMRLRGLL